MKKIKTNISITFLGTGQHRDTHRSVLVSAHNQINSLAQDPNSHVAAWLLDGPGCIGTIEHPTPGTYYYKDGKNTNDPLLAAGEVRRFRDALSEVYRAVTSEGVESSILEATHYLEEIIVQNKGVLPTELNLQGFSRGADNCVRLANIIYLLYPDIKINLFLVDPVPGPGRRDDPESYHMPPNVNNCHITLMLNEHRNFYDPQHAERYVFTNPQTSVAYHYLPGRHGAGLATNEKKATTPAVSQTLVQDCLLKFNIEHKALPKDATNQFWHKSAGGKNIPEAQITPPLSKTERFKQLCIAMTTYKSLAARPEVTYYHKRRIYTDRARYILDEDLFLDSEHRALFKTLFPATFNWFFEKNFTPPGAKKPYSKQEVFSELQTLKVQPYVDFYTNLIAKFKIPAVSQVEDIIAEPQGIARDEKAGFNEPLVRDELTYLQFCLSTIVNEYHYRVPYTFFGSWFPGSDMSLSKSWQSDHIAKKIKEAVKDSYRLPPSAAKKLLKALIVEIKSKPNQEFFFRQISKIIPDSRKYLKSVQATLKRYQEMLPPDYAALVEKAAYLIQKQMDHPLKDEYQKRVRVQEYLLSLSTGMHRLNTKFAVKNILCEQLFTNLNQLSSPSYAEPGLLDTTIYDLESYIRRRTFYSYFPFSKMLGFYNSDNISLTQGLLDELNQIKNSSASQANLMQIEAALKHTSMTYAHMHRNEESDTKFAFWKKHVSFKTDPLNQLIAKHLTKVTQLSGLIFSIPNAPEQSSGYDEHRDFFLK